ncbi:MAG TPA: hypothetical protein VLE22_14710 [Bryobacteraceae bacterium]|nr:hypothetical protein [Bryobacteraceae bacterium]
MKAAIVFVAAICTAQVRPAMDQNGQQLLAKVRATTGRALKSLPNYVCLETTVRLQAPKLKAIAKAKALDTVELEVAHVGDKEMYSLPGRNMFADAQLTEVLPSGLVGTGAYSSHLIDVLYGPGTQFRWVGKETLGGRAVLRWDFTVPKASSGWTLAARERSVRVGSEGSLWADAATLSIVRLTSRATSLPARFPLKFATRTIDYASVHIGAGDVLLPSAAEDVVEHSGGVNINRSRFGHCREFSTSSTVTFAEAGAPAPAPRQPAEPAPAASSAAQRGQGQQIAALNALPKGVRISLALDEHLRSENAVIGSAVNAHVRSDVRRSGAVLIPKGTPVRGVLRDFVKVRDGFSSSMFTATIEFTELVLSTGAIPFDAFLKSVDVPVRGLYWLIPGEEGTMKAACFRGPGSADPGDQFGRVRRKPKPGVAVLIFSDQPAFDLSPGTPMTWTTVESETR